MLDIEAYLCFNCKILLSNYFKVSPLYEPAPSGEICPWCQRDEALMKFGVIEKHK